MATEIHHARALRARLLADPYRPLYHVVTPEGVCAPFDPNGALFWNGRYHLHMIVQTEEGHCWHHISSHDLIHWRHHGLSLEPGGVDEGIFSGGAFIDRDGVPTITYWGLGRAPASCLATSTDPDLAVWTKSPANPVIPQTSLGIYEDGHGLVYGAADPSAIWVHEGRYYMLTGNLLVLRAYGSSATWMSTRATLPISSSQTIWSAGTTWALSTRPAGSGLAPMRMICAPISFHWADVTCCCSSATIWAASITSDTMRASASCPRPTDG